MGCMAACSNTVGAVNETTSRQGWIFIFLTGGVEEFLVGFMAACSISVGVANAVTSRYCGYFHTK